MTKKEKRKKQKQEKKKETEEKDVSNETNKTNASGKSNSRSRSRGRRSLSSIFRKSNSRAESNDTSTLLQSGDASLFTETEQVINPRINPRGHLQRMTVREALVYDRHRGRSPNRRTKKLEKKILENEARLSSGNLSISLPHLLDQFPEDQSEEPAKPSTSYEARGGSTLPRVKKRRGQSDGRDAQEFRQSDFQGSNISSIHDKPIQILPLDKRKYLINKNADGTHNVETSIDYDIRNDTNKTHSNRKELQIPDEQSDIEKRRHDTYNTFLSLREKKHTLSQVHIPTENQSDDMKNTKPVQNTVNSSQSTPYSSNSQTTETCNLTSKFENEKTYNNLQDTKDAIESPEHANTINAHKQASIIPVNDISPHKGEKTKRSSYVSPRRFSRSSRTSVTSNRSDTSNRSLSSEHKPQQKPTEPIIGPVKYHRHFSREISKSKVPREDKGEETKYLQQMVDASTSMEELPFTSVIAENTNNLDISNIIGTEDNGNALNNSVSEPNNVVTEMHTKDEINQSLENENTIFKQECLTELSVEEPIEDINKVSSLQREVIVIDNESEKNIQTHDHESMFRPIKSDSDLYVHRGPIENDSKIHKSHHVGFEIGEIEVLSTDILIENGQNSENNTDLNVDTRKVKHEKEDTDNKKETEHDKMEKECKKSWSGKSKKEKRKSKKKKEKLRKESGCSNKSIESAESKNLQINEKVITTESLSKIDNDDEKILTQNSKGKKRKSILKRRSKDKGTKSIKDAVKPITRTASLSQFIDKCESAERRKSVSLCDKRSRSMDDITKNTNIENKACEPKEKEEPPKPIPKDSKSADAKDVKQPKLSIAAIVAIRAKISRMKRAKQEQAKAKVLQATDESDLKIEDVSHTGEDTDMSVAKVFYENEINTSLGKSDTSLSLIEDADKEVKDLVYDKRIQFAPFCDDTISEEEMIKQRQRNTRLTSRRESKVRQRQKKVINCCKKGIAFLFSHIGLCSLVVGYCILGGIIFKALEGENEIEQKKEIKELRQNFTEKIYRLAFETTLTKGNRDIFMIEVNAILKNFSVMIHKQTKEAGWDGKEVKMTVNTDGEESVEPEPEQWSYPSSLLYAITVMTTIGYGHVAPKTDEGRIMTIAYAVLGIPLTLLCLTNIGDLMAHGFRSLYGKVCCGLCCILFRPRRRRRLDPEKGLSGAEERMIMQENEKSGEVVHVPTSVCLLLMSSYIMLGTLLFAEWEKWDLVTGTYFCFITLSTIGFGDVVPGMSQTDWDQQEKLVSCALYLVFGLSLIAMCFNLVQEDVKAKCKWLGMKLGIIDKPVSSV
ncbi:uncharacterized protein LOC123534111 [Mercenaria mercenaria]|uniref:uncharacterized protein LOC123534111 n=1 Tax=Mercenaria mercenaria TaxID=6596 RepID=UPI00234EB698|nr:uncharacterized protein LOC123534111 [Mercenaria mercenaria]